MEKDLLILIKKASDVVKSLESKAKKALHEDNDTARYTLLMQEKAMYLENLLSLATPLLDVEDNTQAKQYITSTLSKFSSGAATALRLNSPFYMAALLYPDDHNEGQPNNLDLLVTYIENLDQ